MRIQRCTAALACLVLLGCGGSGLRLSPRYVAVHNTMAAMGLAQTGQISEGSLAEGDEARFTTQLRSGDCYTIVAFGTEGVENLDVVVQDASGAEVATDRTHEQQAAAQLCPEADGEYQVVVRMARGNGGYIVTSWSGGAAAGAVTPGAGSGTCRSPTPLRVGTPVRGNTTQGTSAMSGTCIRGGNAPEVVYAITLEERAQVTATLDANYDGALYLLATCADARSEIACNDDDMSVRRSRIETTLDPGTYFVVVDGWASEAGEYELMVETSALQDLAQVCQSAQQLTPGQAVTGQTTGQPSYFTATCAGGAASPDRVYAIDVPSRSRMRVRMQSTHDGALYVRRDCQNPNTEVACNDDHRDTRHSMVVTTVDPGRYFIYADGYGSGNSGNFSLRADLAPLTGGAAPADACSAPGTLVPGQDLELDTFPAADDLAGSCGGQGAPDVVYRVEVQNRVRLRARMMDSEFPGAMYIQRSCGQSSSEVVCSAGRRGAPTELDVNLQPGVYFLVIDGVGQDDFGAARVEVQLDDLQALEQACRQAPRLRPGRTVTGDTSSSRDRFQASCAGGARSADLVYQLVVPRRSRVRVTASQQYDGALYIRRDCVDPSSELACNDDAPHNRQSEVDVVLDRGTYFVFVDGFGDRSQGAFTLDVQLTRP